MSEAGSGAREVEYLKYCANCGRSLPVVSLWYWEFAGRIQLFCSERCYDRYRADPVRSIVVSPRGQA